MTRDRINAKGEGSMVLADREVTRAMVQRRCAPASQVKVRITEYLNAEAGWKDKTRIVDTTIGRALLFRILPKGLPFELVNRPMKKKAISNLINTAYRTVGLKDTVIR